jgi:diaminopimelate decarboxylase
VYRRSVIEARYQEIKAIPYSPKRIFYSCKANTNPEVLAVLKNLGAGIEAVSPGEIEKALAAGFVPEDISFTASNISKDELRQVTEAGVQVHLDSLNQLRWHGEMHPGTDVSIRVNKGIGAGHHSSNITGGPNSKFGVYHTDIPEALGIARENNLRITGLHQHIGSGIKSSELFLRGARGIIKTAEDFADLEHISVGGGFGVPYSPDDAPFDIARTGKELARLFKALSAKRGRDIGLILEPGRYLTAEAGALLATVTDMKKTPKHNFVGVNTGFNHLIRPVLYGSYHHIFNLSRPDAKAKKVTVAGNLCESGDIFAKNRLIPEPQIGDLLLFADAGTGGYMLASDYNSRPKPKEVLI